MRSYRRLARRCAVGGMLTLAVNALAPPATAATEAAVEQCLLDRANAERLAAGLDVVRPDAELLAWARAWSRTMADTQHLGHSNMGVLGAEVFDWDWMGENVGLGSDCDGIHVTFMESGPHAGIILDPAATHVGIGAAMGPADEVWVTQVFLGSTVEPRPTELAGAAGFWDAPSSHVFHADVEWLAATG